MDQFLYIRNYIEFSIKNCQYDNHKETETGGRA